MDKFRRAFLQNELKTRAEESGARYIEGYFIVFNQRTELWSNEFEEIAPESVTESLAKNDIRCLYNHNSDIVLGRTSSKTLTLRADAHGVWGSMPVNEDDQQACDAYARIKRGDISGCSFGFNPTKWEYSDLDGGGMLCRITGMDLREVSVCTFPQYEQTDIQARHKDFAAAATASREKQKNNIKERLEKLKKC